MNVSFHDDAAQFLAVVAPVYQRDPVLHTVELTLLRGDPLPGAGTPLLISVWDGGELIGAAMQTPPFPLLCNGLPPDAVPAVVAELVARDIGLGGARGLRATALDFAGRWTAATGCSSAIDIEERLYRLGTLHEPAQVLGAARRSRAQDAELLIEWAGAFAAEVFGAWPDWEDTRAALRAADAAGDVHLLWIVDGEPVSLARARSPAAGVSRIGPVYTPAGQRGHGYGAAVTAVACRCAATVGAADVVLFADLANSTSNAIYQRIGFEPVADSAHVGFVAP